MWENIARSAQERVFGINVAINVKVQIINIIFQFDLKDKAAAIRS